jgi:uncharacterized protein YcbK (DUF882 family)
VATTVGRQISLNFAGTFGRVRKHTLASILARAGSRLGMAGMLLLGASNSLQNAVAEGDTRTLSFHHVHTGEDITVTFKRNGRYDEAALKKLDWFMRDWRKNKEVHMDPRLFDLLWEVYRDVGATQPIQIICGYRSSGTNEMLRERSSGVARYSQHINGQAIDFFIPGVSLATIRAEGLKLQRGGVGFYPTSGSPFVHMDTGLVRHWPRIPRDELVRIFPDGRTVHIPADGKPLRNYALALADVERRGNAPSSTSLEAARDAGVISESQLQQAELVQAEARAEKPHQRSLLARLFGMRKGEDEPVEKPAAPRQARAPVAVASVAPAKSVATKRIVPLPAARPASVMLAAATPRAPEPTMTTASVSTRMIESRNIWGDVVKVPGPPEAAASDQPSAANLMAYAAEAQPTAAPTRARPMGDRVPRLAREARVIPGPASVTIAVKAPDMSIGGQRSDSPWLRAAMLTPSVSEFMTSTRLGETNPVWLHELLHKPEQSLVMTFSADPHLGMLADRFSGHAVVFLATATFAPQTTASLR